MTDYDLLQAMRGAMHPLTPGEVGGSHTEVYAFDPKALRTAFEDLAAAHGGDPASAALEADRISARFLVKVGNIRQYVIKLRDGGASVIRRPLVSEAFGAAGYNLAPTIEKFEVDTREAVREIPYFGAGEVEAQFAPDLLDNARRVVTGQGRRRLADGTSSIRETDDGRISKTAWDILAEDPYFKTTVSDFAALRRFQDYLREHPLDLATTERLQSFFDAPITVGVRDVLRYLEGARHPTLGWERASEVIRSCFAAHGAENFLPPEINYYTRSIGLDPGEVASLSLANTRASRAFARWLVARLPFEWTTPIPDRELEAMAAGILEAHFDYPLFEVEPYSGILSASGLRLLLRVAVGTTLHLGDIDVPERRNPITPALTERIRPVAAFLESLSEADRSRFLVVVNGMLWEVAAAGGVPDGEGGVLPYRRVDRTFYSFQEKAQFGVQSQGTVEELLTLEDLLDSRGQAVLDSHPELPRKLVVFFVLAYRYFQDTGHVPDLRPDDAGLDLFVRGIWGYKTRNVLVTTGRDRLGRPTEQVRFVDNKDQFKQYRRFEDRGRPLGLIKYGVRLVHPVVRPAMERSIGLYVQRVADSEGRAPPVVPDLPMRAAAVTREVLRSGVDSLLTQGGAVLHDLIDDSSDAVEQVLRRLPGKASRGPVGPSRPAEGTPDSRLESSPAPEASSTQASGPTGRLSRDGGHRPGPSKFPVH